MNVLKTAFSLALASTCIGYAFSEGCTENVSPDDEFQKAWESYTIASGLGLSGMHTFDSDFDNLPEVIFGTGQGFGPNTSFVIAEFNPNAHGLRDNFKIVCQSDFYDASITSIQPFSNNQIDIGSVIGFSNGDIEIVDHIKNTSIVTFNAFNKAVKDITVKDADNNGRDDLVVLYEDRISVIDTQSFREKLHIPLSTKAKAIAVGKLSDTKFNSIAVNTGMTYLVINGVPLVDWDYSQTGFSNYLMDVADIDADGLDEIVGVDSWYNYRAFNADTKDELWSQTTRLDIDALTLADFTGDGTPEVILGDGQWGDVTILNGLDGTAIHKIDNPSHGVTQILIGQLDDDHSIEVMWGAGHSSTGPDYLYVYDKEQSAHQWKSPELEGPFFGAELADINNDGQMDIIYASFESESGYDSGIVRAATVATGEIIWESNRSNSFTYIHDLHLADINYDGVLDVLIATGQPYTGQVIVLDGQRGSQLYSMTLESGSPIYSVDLIDIDGDGLKEVIAGGGKEHTGAKGKFIYQLDFENNQFKRISDSLDKGWSDIWTMAYADINFDSVPEILAFIENKLFSVDIRSGASSQIAEGFISFASLPNTLFSDGHYLGSDQGELYQFTKNGLAPAGKLCLGQVNAIEAFSTDQLVFTCNNRLGIFNVKTRKIEWQSDRFENQTLGIYDRISVNSDGQFKYIAVGGKKVYVFSTAQKKTRLVTQFQ